MQLTDSGFNRQVSNARKEKGVAAAEYRRGRYRILFHRLLEVVLGFHRATGVPSDPEEHVTKQIDVPH